MKFRKSRAFFVRVISLALVSAGFAQISFAGVVGTDYMLEAEARNASLARVESLIAREDVAQQLQAFGVDQFGAGESGDAADFGDALRGDCG